MNGVLLSLTLSAAIGGSWNDDYYDAWRTAKKSHQPILVVFEKGTTNHPLARQPDVTTQALLQPYILCRVDASTDRGRKLASAFKVTSYPYTAIVDKEVKTIIYRRPGHPDTREMVKVLVDYASGRPRRRVQVTRPAAECFT